jgi:AmmeMemoRadiSam system protein B
MHVLRPRLRAVDVVMLPDEGEGPGMLLRDLEGVSPGSVWVPLVLAPAVARLDGRHTAPEIVARCGGGRAAFDLTAVEDLVEELDAALLLETARYRARRGGAYHADPDRLRRYIDADCLGAAAPPSQTRGTMAALCAPHMDLWRAAEGYGQAYAALAHALQDGCRDVDTFVVLGTSHARMRQPFAVCDKPFATPLGAMEADREAIAELRAGTRFDIEEDVLNHKTEHSIELQVVFLRHLLGRRAAAIVPVLCGLGEAQARAVQPTDDAAAESFAGALAGVIRRRRGRVLVIAGADLAHVGPRFGDTRPLDGEERRALAERDHESVQRAAVGDARAFFDHVVEDLDTRRVCGVGPIYTLLRTLPAGAAGHRLGYSQCVDPREGSVVSHASLGFYA